MKIYQTLSLLLVASLSCSTAFAKASSRNVDKTLKRFVAKPHPMGSDEQKKLANEYQKQLNQFGWKARLQPFTTEVPNAASQKFGSKESLASAPATLKKEGYNVVAVRAGQLPCAIIVGGHYDTKHFEQFKFVGANDGGSSTAMILEVARALGKPTKSKNAVLQNCDLHFVLFDGEEATLADWSAAEQRGFDQGDHLYGSHVFANDIAVAGKSSASLDNKEIVVGFVFDMVGHKQQKLFITNGSDTTMSQKWIEVAKKAKIDIEMTSQMIEDDHVPLAKRGVKFVHVIDWTNLQEWHTERDTLEIIDSKKIATLADAFVAFLKETKYEK